jgi:ribosomal protein L29
MTIKELRTKSDVELLKDLSVLREKQRELRFKIHSQELKNTSEVKVTRKEAAQILTILSQRSLEAAE